MVAGVSNVHDGDGSPFLLSPGRLPALLARRCLAVADSLPVAGGEGGVAQRSLTRRPVCDIGCYFCQRRCRRGRRRLVRLPLGGPLALWLAECLPPAPLLPPFWSWRSIRVFGASPFADTPCATLHPVLALGAVLPRTACACAQALIPRPCARAALVGLGLARWGWG